MPQIFIHISGNSQFLDCSRRSPENIFHFKPHWWMRECNWIYLGLRPILFSRQYLVILLSGQYLGLQPILFSGQCFVISLFGQYLGLRPILFSGQYLVFLLSGQYLGLRPILLSLPCQHRNHRVRGRRALCAPSLTQNIVSSYDVQSRRRKYCLNMRRHIGHQLFAVEENPS